MCTTKITHLFAAAILLALPLGACAQSAKSAAPPDDERLEFAVSYQSMLANPVGGNTFWFQGGSAQLHGQFWHGLGTVADVAGLHAGNIGTNVNADLVTATFGPRYSWQIPRKRCTVYGQALVGEAFGLNSVFPGASSATETANSLAIVLGGGVNYSLRPRLSLRILDANWVRTQLPNATTNVQNNLRIGAGLVLRIK